MGIGDSYILINQFQVENQLESEKKRRKKKEMLCLLQTKRFLPSSFSFAQFTTIPTPFYNLDANPKQIISQLLDDAMEISYPGKPIPLIKSIKPHVEYQFPLFNLSKKEGIPPIQIANTIIHNIPKNNIIEKASFSPPGFVNIQLNNDWISERIFEIIGKGEKNLEDNFLVPARTSTPLRVLIDFASPNMCKELHVGHLRSTVLGNSISQILSHLGHNVTGISHVGDFGTPIGTVLAQAFETEASFLKDGHLPHPSELSKLYVEAKKRFGKDQRFTKYAYEQTAELQKLDKGKPEVYNAWKLLCNASRKGFEEIFKRLDVKVTEQGESFYEPMLNSIIKELEEKNMIKNSDKARCVFLNDDPSFTPVVVQKSDGSHLYSTTDLAAIKHRIDNKMQWIIYVTDDSQKLHFQNIFKV